MRALVRETTLVTGDLIAPLFVRPGVGVRQPISSMPGQTQWSVDTVVEEARELAGLGIPAVIMFGIPEEKDARGSGNLDPGGVVPSAIRAIKKELPELVVISDMCFCEYTEHGHCGIVNLPGAEHYRPDLPHGYLLNDVTLDLLGQASVVHAAAGADVIAPSGMLDGMVGAIRGALDGAGLDHTAIMSYAVKYASALLRPVPRGGRVSSAVRRPRAVSDGPGQPAGSAPRDGSRRGRRGRHHHGQAGSAVPGRHQDRPGFVRSAPRCLPGERGVFDDPGRRGQRVAGPASGWRWKRWWASSGPAPT